MPGQAAAGADQGAQAPSAALRELLAHGSTLEEVAGTMAALRQRAGLTPGVELEITADETGVRIQRVAPGPRIVKVGRRLVAKPTARPDSRPVVDVAALIEEERNRWP